MASRLSLAAKLYSIFALFAMLVAAITALSQYNTSQNAELTEQVSIASRAALNVERINSLVYAVVMESRGVYMSAEPAVVKKYGDGLLKFNGRILEVVKNWQALVQDDDAQQFATFKKRIEQFIDFRKELVRRGVEINGAAGREWGDNDANREVRTALNKDLGLTDGFDAQLAIDAIEAASEATVSLVGRYAAAGTPTTASGAVVTAATAPTTVGPTVTNGPSPT